MPHSNTHIACLIARHNNKGHYEGAHVHPAFHTRTLRTHGTKECQSWVVRTPRPLHGIFYLFFIYIFIYFFSFYYIFYYYFYIYIFMNFYLFINIYFFLLLLLLHSYFHTHNYMNCDKMHKFTQQQLYWDTHRWRYTTRAVTKAQKFTRHSSPGHNGPIEPRSVNHKMESQGHYMETFSFLLVIHLCIDLFDFLLFFIVNIYFLYLSNFILLSFCYCIFLNINTYT